MCPQVSSTVGAEQEYFLIDKEEYKKRRDLILTGRTLFGCPPAKGQEMEEHYFGVIRPVVSAYMKEVDESCGSWASPPRPSTTRLPLPSMSWPRSSPPPTLPSTATLLTMEVMRQVAEKHGLVCLLHEKPFEGVNGSGKHKQLVALGPGPQPPRPRHQADGEPPVPPSSSRRSSRRSTSTRTSCGFRSPPPGNDHRLGANEAPPAIISMFVGDELGAVIDALADDAEYHDHESQNLDLGVAVLPKFSKDNTDRNRTPPPLPSPATSLSSAPPAPI